MGCSSLALLMCRRKATTDYGVRLAVQCMVTLKKKKGKNLMKKFDLSGDKPELALCAPVAEFDIILMEIILRMLDQEKTQRMMHSKEAAALRCKYLGGNIPYGFAVNDATGGFTINEDEADNVRMAFAMVAGGAPDGVVLRCLHKVGAKTRAGSDFTYATLRSMLQNEQCLLCRDHQLSGFADGIKVGLLLAKELHE